MKPFKDLKFSIFLFNIWDFVKNLDCSIKKSSRLTLEDQMKSILNPHELTNIRVRDSALRNSCIAWVAIHMWVDIRNHKSLFQNYNK